MRLVVAISGASGVALGRKFVHLLPKDVEVFTIYTENAKKVIELEENEEIFDDESIGAKVASGSFQTDAMIVVPCSMNTLAKIACGIADNLTTRVASVMIKEQRKLLLAPREMPFSPIAMENMLKLAKIGVVIAPPVLGYYSDSTTLEEMENFLIGKWFDVLGIEHELYRRWGE